MSKQRKDECAEHGRKSGLRATLPITCGQFTLTWEENFTRKKKPNGIRVTGKRISGMFWVIKNQRSSDEWEATHKNNIRDDGGAGERDVGGSFMCLPASGLQSSGMLWISFFIEFSSEKSEEWMWSDVTIESRYLKVHSYCLNENILWFSLIRKAYNNAGED